MVFIMKNKKLGIVLAGIFMAAAMAGNAMADDPCAAPKSREELKEIVGPDYYQRLETRRVLCANRYVWSLLGVAEDDFSAGEVWESLDSVITSEKDSRLLLAAIEAMEILAVRYPSVAEKAIGSIEWRIFPVESPRFGDGEVREAAVRAIGHIGQTHKHLRASAFNSIMDAENDNSQDVRYAIIGHAMKLASDDSQRERLMTTLNKFSETGNLKLSHEAARLLRIMRERPSPAPQP
jgi:hypothetical protein